MGRRDIGKSIFRIASVTVFVALFIFAGITSVAASSVFWGTFAGILFTGVFLYTLVPFEKLRNDADRLRTGEAGEGAYEETVSKTEQVLGWFK